MTNLQEVFDSFFIKFPSINFTGKESQVIQLLKSAIARCHRRVYDDLTYEYDDVLHTGFFINTVGLSTIELISMFMAKEFATQGYNIIVRRKQYLGTQAFNKIPSYKEEFSAAESSVDYWNREVERFMCEFPDYTEDR